MLRLLDELRERGMLLVQGRRGITRLLDQWAPCFLAVHAQGGIPRAPEEEGFASPSCYDRCESER